MPEPDAGLLQAEKILVIDDEPLLRQAISRILERAGYVAISAADGVEGLAAFRRERPALVITDLIMPEREGIETIRHILRDAPDTKIIAISGSGFMGAPDFLGMARELGASEILRKPFEARDLIALVTFCLDETGTIDHP